jgi:DNA-binding MarR family transcriptional regulator
MRARRLSALTEGDDLNDEMLSDGEAMRTWYRFIRLHSRVRAAFAIRLRKLDITVPQCDMLTTLSQSEGISQQELAERLYVTKGNISILVDKLAANGYVERLPSTLDRRTWAINLTERGRETAKLAIMAQKQFVSEIFGPLSNINIDILNLIMIELRSNVLNVRK